MKPKQVYRINCPVCETRTTTTVANVIAEHLTSAGKRCPASGKQNTRNPK